MGPSRLLPECEGYERLSTLQILEVSAHARLRYYIHATYEASLYEASPQEIKDPDLSFALNGSLRTWCCDPVIPTAGPFFNKKPVDTHIDLPNSIPPSVSQEKPDE